MHIPSPLRRSRWPAALAVLLTAAVAPAQEKLPPGITLSKIEAQGYDVWQSRPALARWDKLALIARVVARKLKAMLG